MSSTTRFLTDHPAFGTRQAADTVGATRMDRPEWIAVDSSSGHVYATLTNNSQRGGTGRPPVDARLA